MIPKNDAESFSQYVIAQLQSMMMIFIIKIYNTHHPFIVIYMSNLILIEYGRILPIEIEEKLREIHERIPEISSIYYIELVLQ